MLKKLAKNQIVMVLAAVVAVSAVYLYSKGFSPLSGLSNANEAVQAVDTSSRSNGNGSACPGGNNFVPAQPLGQNEGAAPSNGTTNTYGLPPSCAKQSVVDPKELLPRNGNNEFNKLNPQGSGDLKNVSLLKAGWHIGINTVGQILRNANLELRSEPPNPQLNTGPWNQSTISADVSRRPLEIGCGN